MIDPMIVVMTATTSSVPLSPTPLSPTPLSPTPLSPTPLSPTPRSTVRRSAARASRDRADLHAVLDAGLVGHLGLNLDTGPMVVPTGYGRDGETLYLHGSTGASTLRAAAAGVPVCFTVSLLDGIVYSRSVFHHSMNYRCAIVQGTARLITDPDRRWHGLRVLTEHLAPGSWGATRLPDRRELAATAVLELDLAEASVKIRTGPPGEDDRDLEPGANAAWAGVLPLVTTWGDAVPCPLLPAGIPVPERVLRR